MISLFLTALLGLFCCSSITNNALDNTKEIEVKEQSVKNFGYIDELGLQIYLTKNDLLSGVVLETFILNVPNELGLGFSSSNLDMFTWTGMDATFHVLTDNHVGGGLFGVDKFTLQKYGYVSTTFDGEEYTIQTYRFAWGYQNYQVLTIEAVFSVPFLDNHTHDLGISCMSATIFGGSISSYNMVYVENSNDSQVIPWIAMFFNPYVEGHNDNSYNAGYQSGYINGRSNGYSIGYDDGRAVGYNEGLTAGASYNQTALTIFTGFIEVGLLPVNVFLQILNFEVFGINIGGFVSALLTIAIVVIVIRIVTGNKND